MGTRRTQRQPMRPISHPIAACHSMSWCFLLCAHVTLAVLGGWVGGQDAKLLWELRVRDVFTCFLDHVRQIFYDAKAVALREQEQVRACAGAARTDKRTPCRISVIDASCWRLRSQEMLEQESFEMLGYFDEEVRTPPLHRLVSVQRERSNPGPTVCSGRSTTRTAAAMTMPPRSHQHRQTARPLPLRRSRPVTVTWCRSQTRRAAK